MKSTNVQTLGALRMCSTANNGLELMGMHVHMVLAMLVYSSWRVGQLHFMRKFIHALRCASKVQRASRSGQR